MRNSSSTPGRSMYGPTLAVFRAMMVVLSVAMLAINAYFLYYMDRLERDGCKCAQGWKRTFVEGSLILWLASAVIHIFVGLDSTWFWVGPIVQLVILANIFVTRAFIMQIKSGQCACAKTDAFKLLNIVNGVQLGFLAAALLIIIIVLVGAFARSHTPQLHTGSRSK